MASFIFFVWRTSLYFSLVGPFLNIGFFVRFMLAYVDKSEVSFSIGSCLLSHPDKVDRGGEDALLVSNYNGGVLAIVDGVSGIMSALPTTQEKTIPDATNYKGAPAERSKTGGWSTSAMIIGGEVMERMTTLGIAVNLVTYLTGTMHLGNAESTNVLHSSFPSFTLMIGIYHTIAIFAAVQATGVAILAMSMKIPSLHPPKCTGDSGGPCERATSKQLTIDVQSKVLKVKEKRKSIG
ncbi:hypothetical protein S245_005215, partial [Arachis hypogaea]